MDEGVNRAATRASLVSNFLTVLGPERESDAERLADEALRYQDVLLTVAANPMPLDASKFTGPQVVELVRGHIEGVCHAAFLAMLRAMQEAAKVGARR